MRSMGLMLPLALSVLVVSFPLRGDVQIPVVTVGNLGNPVDMTHNTGYGGVDYAYRVGVYEVTAGQYCEFLNKVARSDPYGLYNSAMATSTTGCKITRSGSSGSYTYNILDYFANRPVNFVSFWDACRFVNWLNNGQGTGGTESGSYNLAGYNGTDGRTISRQPEWSFALPTKNEWYKAAYYDPQKAGYWNYATLSDTISVLQANYNWTKNGPCNVGTFSYPSAYGTYDQCGNVFEWTEAASSYGRAKNGGSFDFYGAHYMNTSSCSIYDSPAAEMETIGFRIVAIPEPGTVCILLCACSLVFRRTKQSLRSPGATSLVQNHAD